MALELGTALYIKRVPTKDNLSDDPSRERYGLLRKMGVSQALSRIRSVAGMHAFLPGQRGPSCAEQAL